MAQAKSQVAVTPIEYMHTALPQRMCHCIQQTGTVHMRRTKFKVELLWTDSVLQCATDDQQDRNKDRCPAACAVTRL